ncbi:MAG: hypothetical protein ACO1OB_17450 [Archangium sp.]
MSPPNTQTVGFQLAELGSPDPRARANMLRAFTEVPPTDSAVIAACERLMNDTTLTLLGIPYRFGEVRSVAAEAVWAIRRRQGIDAPVVLRDALPVCSTNDIGAYAREAGLDIEPGGIDGVLKTLVRLVNENRIPRRDWRLETIEARLHVPVVSSSVAYMLAFAPARRDALDASKKLFTYLGHPFDDRERVDAEQRIAAAKKAAGNGEAAPNDSGTRLGTAAYQLLFSWCCAERIAFLREGNATRLVSDAHARAAEVKAAWTKLVAEVAASGNQAATLRLKKLEKFMKYAPAADATKSVSFSTAHGEMADFIKTLDMQLGAFAKDLSTPHDVTVAEAMKLGARDVKVHATNAVELTMDAGSFITHAKTLFAKVNVSVLHLTNAKAHLAAVANVPELLRIATLDLKKQSLSDDDLQPLLHSKYVHALRVLDLTQNELTERSVEALASATATNLPQLERVGLQLNRCHDPADQLQFIDETTRVPVAQASGAALEAKFGRLKWLHPHDG